MSTQIMQILHEKFAYSSFRTGQREAIESVLDKKDTLVMLPTGSGKSLCYQLPTYLTDGVTLIISPLLSLMQDQVEQLHLRGEKRAVALNSLTSFSERKRIFRQIKQYKFIYTSPEMLQNQQVLEVLKKAHIQLFVVDEAHCISHWGTDFRPDYLALANIRKSLGSPTTMALTATATKQVRDEIIHFLGLDIKETNQIIESVDRKEIKFFVEICEGNKNEKLIEIVKKMTGAGIIYFTSKKMADEWANNLSNEYGLRASSYHSDLEADDKIKIQQQFLNNDLQIICATSAFGMGFNKKDIRFIIHYHLPSSPEMYLQEVGRASRDGKLGLAILLYQPGDEYIQQRFIETSLPSKEILTAVYKRKQTQLSESDAMVKLAYYFKETSINLNDALQAIEKRKKIKYQQLSFMMQYVYQEDCKRSYLLNYFCENKKSSLNECCSSCGLDQEELIAKLNKMTQSYKEEEARKRVLPWKEVYNNLYNNL
ncbi:ATP-dependent DNA helicase RecQ [Atopostipes suicloacalis DSM 15692]|uniref:ATP-dependent DNA helicase RecQ n=1 Tax=Atopostipes suicloacalis DSM 15692 TaxID=1121025 RepID=A0A1M4TCB8_9LACT|nr:ATP-dependent DNA helicase RecQ [Atopostipes suicloacalis]SHE42025.1 ATP-dependent DNA helicase RecQ [Atopostipes suicloacalis DSM 15692]